MNVSTTLQLGLYRDGDNNLDRLQAPLIDQAFAAQPRATRTSPSRSRTSPPGRDFALPLPVPRTESYAIRAGEVDGDVHAAPERNPSARSELAHFVARTLDDAQANHAAATWIDLVDHGGGDGGGLESRYGVMRSDDMAGAVADGVALHARAHPRTPAGGSTACWPTSA